MWIAFRYSIKRMQHLLTECWTTQERNGTGTEVIDVQYGRGTGTEVIDAQYGRGRWTQWSKLGSPKHRGAGSRVL